ncbi:MAG: hypothetical protein ACOZF0_08925 [Thermodesulfobacteriota bacterium]
MHQNLTEQIQTLLGQRQIPVMGAAPAEALNRKAPAGFRPADFLADAASVLILAKPLPVSVFTTPPATRNRFYITAFSAYYRALDDAALQICLLLEEAGYPSLPIPSYSPIRFHEGEPKGLMSLKHAAAEAGLGKLGKNTLLIHPQYGNVLRLGGLVTTLEWAAADRADLSGICPEGCRQCVKSCPVGALDSGSIDKLRCMAHCLEHVLMPPKLLLRPLKWVIAKSSGLTRFMEVLTLNFFAHYGIECTACLKACPHFPATRSSAGPVSLGEPAV